MKHTHPVGPKPSRGRPGPDWLRCISCGYSTRNKETLACSLSDTPGGRLCLKCASRLPDNCPPDCISWLTYLLNKQMCQSCTKLTDVIVNCEICHRYLCVACVVPETFHMWGDLGISGIVCMACCPETVRVKPDGLDNYCFLCVDSHIEGTLPPCQNPLTKEVPLLSFLREGKLSHSRAKSVVASLSSTTLHSEITNFVPLNVNHVCSINNNDTNPCDNLLPPSRPCSVVNIPSTSHMLNSTANPGPSPLSQAHPNSAYSVLSAVSPRPIGTQTSHIQRVPLAHASRTDAIGTVPAGTLPDNIAESLLLPTLENRLSKLVNQLLLPISNTAAINAANFSKLSSRLDSLSISPLASSSHSDPPNTVGIQFNPTILRHEKLISDNDRPLDFKGMKEIMSLQAQKFSSEISGLKSSISNLSSSGSSQDHPDSSGSSVKKENSVKFFNRRNNKRNRKSNAQSKSNS